MIEHALAYAGRGWAVFPLHNIEPGGTCSCGTRCQTRGFDPGKHPRTKTGFKEATTDAAQIREWWTRFPRANIGIATGPASGLWVLDIDTKHSVDIGGGLLMAEGEHSLRVLIDENDPLPTTLTQVTGSGGHHYVWDSTDRSVPVLVGNRTGVRPGIDVRGDGGYIVAPPSNHLSGSKYHWVDPQVEPAAAPAWLIDLVTTRQPAGEGSSAFSASDILGGGRIRVGERDDTLFRLGAFYRGVHGFDLPQLHALLMGHNMNDTEEPLPAEAILRIATSASKLPINAKENELILPSGAITSDDTTVDEGADLAVSLFDFMGQDITPPVAIVKDLIDGGSGIILAGPPNVGKSWVALDLALAVATGTPFLRHWDTERGPVLIIDEEGTEWGDQRRFDMLLEGRGIGSAHDIPIHLAIGRGFKLDTPKGLTAIRRMIERYRPVLVIVDSLIRVHGGDENVSKDMSAFFEVSTRLMNSTGAAFLFVHHVRKIGILDQGLDPGELMRGSSEIRAWPSIGFVMLPGNDGMVELYNIKQRWREKVHPMSIRVRVQQDQSMAQLGITGKLEPKNQSAAATGSRLLDIVRELSVDQDPTAVKVASMINKSTNTTKEHLDRLVAGGILTKRPADRQAGQRGSPPMAYYPITPVSQESDDEPEQETMWPTT